MDELEEPVQPKTYDLAELPKQITPENLHEEADFGPPLGKEMLTPSVPLD
jgi:antitoxin MazE